MKQGTTPTLSVCVDVNINDVDKIEFLFAQDFCERSRTKLVKIYPSQDVWYENETFKISFTEEETYMFSAGEKFYMDTRITFTTGKIPATSIVTLEMSKTLFEESGGSDD